jgi:hypothetical protein
MRGNGNWDYSIAHRGHSFHSCRVCLRLVEVIAGRLVGMSFVDLKDLNLTAEEFHRNIKKMPQGEVVLVDEVDLSENNLSSVPRSLVRFCNVTVVRLNNNKLRSLPTWLCKLTKLKWLHVNNNCLESVPASLASLSLSRFLAYGNPLLPSWIGRGLFLFFNI